MPLRSLKIALVVGVLLNLINQGDVLWGEGQFSLPKLLLTFVMPYLVSTYGAVAFRLSRIQNQNDTN